MPMLCIVKANKLILAVNHGSNRPSSLKYMKFHIHCANFKLIRMLSGVHLEFKLNIFEVITLLYLGGGG